MEGGNGSGSKGVGTYYGCAEACSGCEGAYSGHAEVYTALSVDYPVINWSPSMTITCFQQVLAGDQLAMDWWVDGF